MNEYYNPNNQGEYNNPNTQQNYYNQNTQPQQPPYQAPFCYNLILAYC